MARAKKETAAVTEEVKAEPKKTTKTVKVTKTTTTKEACPEISCTIEFGGKNTTIESIVESIKEAYKNEGNKAAIKKIDVYIQPENNVAYYVINGVEEGKNVNF